MFLSKVQNHSQNKKEQEKEIMKK